MAAVEAPTPNGYGSNDAPTPDGLEPNLDIDGSDDDDLFGGDDDEPVAEDDLVNNRKLDDDELDSGDDEGRTDRVANTVEDDEDDEQLVEEHKDTVMCDVDLAPIRPPEGDELYLVNLPAYLGLNHRNFDYKGYEPPSKAHDRDSSEKFSPFSTAASTMYWRRDPKDKATMQSNARIVRWSDGSLTLQLASKPTDQYRIFAPALRQTYNGKTNKVDPSLATRPYDITRDTHNYIAAPHATSGLDLQIARPLDAAMRIQASGSLADESVQKLQAQLREATGGSDPISTMRAIKVDPEYERLQAEQAEKDAAKARRRRENAEQRMDTRRDRVLNRGGAGRSTGLSIAGLEDDEGMPSARGSKQKLRGNKRRPTNRRGEIYSDDEDDTLPRGRTREDEYDREDDFLADSEEEPETYEDDAELPEEDEEGDEDAEGEVDDDAAAAVGEERRKRERKDREGEREGTPKRAAAADNDDVDNNAAASADPRASPQARKKRRVIEDEEDDE